MDEQPDRLSTPDRRGQSLRRTVRWRSLLRDALLVLAWVGAVSVGWGLLGWPTWNYYLVVFGGVVGYSLLSEP